MKTLVLAATGLLLSLGLAKAEQTLDFVDQLVMPVIGKDTPGLGVLVMSSGDVIHMRGYGVANIDDETPITETSVFDMASVSKEMTALVARMLIEEGKLSQDTPVGDILEAFAEPDPDHRPITVGDLIHHLSGLTDYLSGDEELDYKAETTNDEVIEWLGDQPLDHAPGTKWDYSNSGYLTLASVIAAVEEKESFAEVIEERVFGPLGMEWTGVVEPAEGVEEGDQVTGYAGTKGKFEESYSPTVTEGDGNVFTNLTDLALYEKALATNQLLGKAGMKALFTNSQMDDGSAVDAEGSGYGYGWVLEEADGDRYASHSGSWMGTATYYQRNLTTGLTVILLSNGEDLDVEGLAADIERAVEEVAN